MIRLFDTYRKKKVPFEPLEPGKVGIYVCGPTVYDISHVGHARCYVAWDIVVRHLRERGLDVRFVRNLTDVDDKIIHRAAETGEPALALSARMVAEYHRDMEALGNLPPDVEPRVSEHLPQIVALVEALVSGGHAYVVEGDVYFRVGSFPGYGTLSGRNLDELRAGARVEVDARKENPLDFALWKAARPGEPSWESPWGPGRPGWHIECSAMSEAYLGETFDIHGGGADLIFPHHENEIAQSRAAHGPCTFARYWMHNGLIRVQTEGGSEEKMSKSLGNFFTIREVCQRHDPEALRLYLLGTHYRSPLRFDIRREGEGITYLSVEEAERRLAYIYATLERLDGALATGKPAPAQAEPLEVAASFDRRFDEAMDDDFNAAAAMGHTSELLSLVNRLLDQPKSAPKPVRRRTLEVAREAMRKVARVLGVGQREPRAFLDPRRARLAAARGIDAAEVEARLRARQEARAARDFARADALRAELEAMGVEVMDRPGGGSDWRVAE